MVRRLTLLLPILGLLAIPCAASAATNVRVGVGDQSPRMFDDANWKGLGLKTTRYFIEWNAISQPAEIADADKFVDAARAHGVKVLMHISTDDINSSPRRPLPSVNDYKVNVGQLINRYKPRGVTDWGVWNEANHKSQPTTKNPKRAAQFYTTMKRLCKGCKIVALDVLDQKGVESYISRWMKAAGKAGKTAKIIGVHNYSQVNRKITEKNASATYPGVARILKAIRKSNKVAKLWLTETGGLASFGTGFPCDKQRQASTTKYMFKLIKKYDKNIERLYTYNWFGAGCTTGFDGGLVDAGGAVRPAFTAFKTGLKGAKR
ncbi:MAG: hypothetical protein QOJ85_3976 [Solirubrobacteraceae bacterium]|nr:hypothetical protein [Solirubrobacteraceae bacterium]